MRQDQATDVGTVEEEIAASTPPRTSRRAMPKWEESVRNQIRSGLRKYSKPLADMVERDANEGDTRLLVTDILCEMLGYDKFLDLTTEYQVKGEFADYGVRIDRQLSALIEVKRVTTKLNVRHLRQVQMYAVNEGVEWIILTNGATWQVYHLTGGLPIVVDLVMSIDILDDSPPATKINHLFLLSRESMKRHQIDDLWQARRATAPSSLASVILSDPVTSVIRRELKKSTGHSIDESELRTLIRETVLREECFAR